MKKLFGLLLIAASVISIVIATVVSVNANYQWDNSVASNWSLSDKASTIAAKADYIDKFIASLTSASLADNDALIYKTADNNCANNVQAVTTLRDRLDQIKGMDESSFQYQQAIQQITQQEQGEADKLMSTLEGCWMKSNHYVLWNPVYGFLMFLGIAGGIIIGIYLLVSEDY